MNKELELWRFAAEKLKQNEPVTLLVVAESKGSSPGRQGFKMAVAGEELSGSIGGGVMEVRLVELAKGKRQTNPKPEIPNPKSNKSQIPNLKSKMDLVHRKNSPDSSGMICSGAQTVIFFELKREHLKTVRQIVEALEDHLEKTLSISDSGFGIADLGTQRFDYRFSSEGEDDFLYQERLGFKSEIYIVGGGHCALALSELMAKMDFYISLFDDREELNTLDKNRFVHRKTVISSYEKIAEFIPSGENVYVVVMTVGYKFDAIVIRKLFDKNFKYFGVLGSRAKMRVLLRELEKDGFDQDRLKNIRTPIGLSINSRTPEEIAVSIAAEIIAVKNAG
ncbi:MAG: XdhC family protein [Pyrinomonadaceae bacterium]